MLPAQKKAMPILFSRIETIWQGRLTGRNPSSTGDVAHGLGVIIQQMYTCKLRNIALLESPDVLFIGGVSKVQNRKY